jgi:hypothetical protein
MSWGNTEQFEKVQLKEHARERRLHIFFIFIHIAAVAVVVWALYIAWTVRHG